MGTTKTAVAWLGLVVVLAGCATSGPCPGTQCEKIGPIGNHYTCKCPEHENRLAGPVAAPVPAAQPTTFTAHYRTSHPCLAKSTRDEVDQVVTWMKQHPGTRGHIVGYTDSTEGRSAALSQRRAWVVRNYMARRGIASDRLSYEGRGSKDPIASNTTAAGRGENRRVEITVE